MATSVLACNTTWHYVIKPQLPSEPQTMQHVAQRAEGIAM